MKEKKPKKRDIFATFEMGSYTIPVVLVSEAEADNEHVYGLFRDVNNHPVVFIQRNLPEPRCEEVLLHEMLHAASDLSGAGLTEKQVSILALILYQGFHTLKRKKKRSKCKR